MLPRPSLVRRISMPRSDAQSLPLAAVAYVRVSDPRQATEDKVSLGQQRQALLALAARLGCELPPPAWFDEPGFSGGTSDRPAFQRMLAYCKEHPRDPASPGLVLCYSDDRWGRFPDPEESAFWRHHLRRLGWTVRYALNDEGGDSSTRVLVRAIHGVKASEERETIRRRAKQGMKGAAEKGFWTNRAPFGYRRVAVDPSTGTKRVLEQGQRKGGAERLTLATGPAAEVAVVRWLFGRYAEGTVSIEQLRREAESRFPKVWSRCSVHHILRNPAYVGDLVAQRHKHGGTTGDTVVRDAFPAIVSRDLYERVQARLSREYKPHTGPLLDYPLSGLITCTTCGNPFVGGGGRKGPTEDPHRYQQYRDAGFKKRPRCPGKLMTFRRRDVEPLVLDAIARMVERPGFRRQLEESFDRLLRATTDSQGTHRAAIEAELVKTERQRDRLVEAVGLELLTEGEARKQLAAVRKRVDDLKAQLATVALDQRRADRIISERDRLTALAVDFRGRAKALKGSALRELLRPWLAQATLDKDRRELRLLLNPLPDIGGATWTPDMRGVLPSTSARPVRGRRCWRGGSRPSSRRSPSPRHWRPPRSTAWRGCWRRDSR
jgi:DNA invertase Pin-like site-specific DNA recombinase